MGALIFLPAGTFDFFGGRLLIGILFIPMFLAGIILMFKSPGLLEKRLNAREEQAEQALVIKLSGLMFAVGFFWRGLIFGLGGRIFRSL